MMNKIIQGSALEALKDLPDQSINCVVTSPPYWGLRDYGTAIWIHGNPSCDHVETELRTGKGLKELSKKYRGGGKKQGKINALQFKSLCKKCGALRIDKQLGLEGSPELYVEAVLEIFQEVHRVLRDDGTLWLNLGDSYAAGTRDYNSFRRDRAHVSVPRPDIAPGLKPKDLVGIPWRVAFALQAAGWYLRSDIIWHKSNPMPESVRDRPTKSHEYLFLLSKSEKYYYDIDAIKEPVKSSASDIKKMKESKERIGGKHKNLDDKFSKASRYTKIGQKRSVGGSTRVHGNLPGRDGGGRACNDPGQLYRNRRTVWSVPTHPFPGAHFATFPEKLIEPCIKAGCPPEGLVLDPFMGSGTVAIVAHRLGCNWLGIELNPEYIEMANKRIKEVTDQRRMF